MPKRCGFDELGSKNLGVKFKFKFKNVVKFKLKFAKKANLTSVAARTDSRKINSVQKLKFALQADYFKPLFSFIIRS